MRLGVNLQSHLVREAFGGQCGQQAESMTPGVDAALVAFLALALAVHFPAADGCCQVPQLVFSQVRGECLDEFEGIAVVVMHATQPEAPRVGRQKRQGGGRVGGASSRAPRHMSR